MSSESATILILKPSVARVLISETIFVSSSNRAGVLLPPTKMRISFCHFRVTSEALPNSNPSATSQKYAITFLSSVVRPDDTSSSEHDNKTVAKQNNKTLFTISRKGIHAFVRLTYENSQYLRNDNHNSPLIENSLGLRNFFLLVSNFTLTLPVLNLHLRPYSCVR